MNSYTVSNLSPDTDYSILLCLRRNSHKIPISVLEVVTRPESYMHQLGIVTDYAAIIAGTDNVQCREILSTSCSGTVRNLHHFYGAEVALEALKAEPDQPQSKRIKLLSFHFSMRSFNMYKLSTDFNSKSETLFTKYFSFITED